jgi:hypothetical protein
MAEIAHQRQKDDRARSGGRCANAIMGIMANSASPVGSATAPERRCQTADRGPSMTGNYASRPPLKTEKCSPTTERSIRGKNPIPNKGLEPKTCDFGDQCFQRLQETARKRSRYATMILIAYRHGLRASELCGLRWDQVDLNYGRLYVRRAKGGIDNVHPLSGKEIRALRQLRRENMESRYVILTELRSDPHGGTAPDHSNSEIVMPRRWTCR